MEPKDWIAIVSVSATVLIFIVTLLANWRREMRQQDRDDRIRKEQQAREDKLRREQQRHEDHLREIERTHTPHIELAIDCKFYGPEIDHFLVDIRLVAHNKGLVQQELRNLRIRVRGIEAGQPLSYWQGREPRLSFPIELVDDAQMIPERFSAFLVEPGVEQAFPFVTKIPSSIKYILAHAKYEYDQDGEFITHTAERVFEVGIREHQEEETS